MSDYFIDYFLWILTHVCCRVVEIGVEVHGIVGVAGKQELHVCGSADGYFPGFRISCDRSRTVDLDSHAQCPFHSVAFQGTTVEQTARSRGCDGGNFMWRVKFKRQVLSGTGTGVAPCHHAVGIAREVLSEVSCVANVETH